MAERDLASHTQDGLKPGFAINERTSPEKIGNSSDVTNMSINLSIHL